MEDMEFSEAESNLNDLILEYQQYGYSGPLGEGNDNEDEGEGESY
jgi:tubulin beta